MNGRPRMAYIFDTGPLFKFLATDCVPQLISAIGGSTVVVPEAVDFEIHDTPDRRPQFRRARDVWKKFPPRFRDVIPDSPSEELRRCCNRVFGIDLETLYRHKKDLGENMMLLHGLSRAHAGEKVVLICDDQGGIAKAEEQIRVLRHRQHLGTGPAEGSLSYAKTTSLLHWAIEVGSFKSQEHFIKKYNMMAELDEALPKKVKDTGLTKRPPWPPVDH